MATMLKAFHSYLGEKDSKENTTIYLPASEILTDAEGSYIEYIRTFDEYGNNTSLEQRFYPDQYQPSSGGTFDHRIVQTRTFDSSGNMLSETWIGGGDLGSMTTYYYYDDSGRRVKSESKYLETGNIAHTTTYSYDDQGNLSIVKDLDSGYTTAYTYDDAGNITSQITTDEEGNKDRYYYNYDNHGNPIKITNITGGNEFVTNYQYTYDEKGRILSEETYDGSGSSSSVSTYEYDSNGNLIKATTKSGTTINTHQYEYRAFSVDKEADRDQSLIPPILYAG